MSARELGNPLGNPLALKRKSTGDKERAIGDIVLSSSLLNKDYLEADGSLVSAIDYPSLPKAYAEVAGLLTSGRTMPASTFWSSVCYGREIFVAVSGRQTATNIAAISSDGISWTPVNLPASALWSAVCYGDGVFVAVATNSASAAWSVDGIVWNLATIPLLAYSAIAFGNGLFVAVATGTNSYATSPDGISWTSRNIGASNYWRSIAFGNGLFVAVGGNSSNAATNTCRTSPDGIAWTQKSMGVSALWMSIAFGGGYFVAVPYQGTTPVRSVDGIDWIPGKIQTGNWQSVCFGDGLFVVVSFISSALAYSRDGLTWAVGVLPYTSNEYWFSIAYGAGVFVAVATNGTANSATINKAFSATQFRLPFVQVNFPVKSYVKVK